MKLELSDDVKALEKRVDELFRDIWSGRFTNLWPSASGKMRRSFTPSSDVFRKGDDLIVKVELPGIDADKDLTVEILEGDLVIRGTRHESEEVARDDYYRQEVWHGSYERRLPLPDGVTDDAIAAEYDKGVLEITIRGAGATVNEPAEPQAKTIPVITK